MLQPVQDQLIDRVTALNREGVLSESSSALLKLFAGNYASRRATIALELSGFAAIVNSGRDEDKINTEATNRYISRQSSSLGGGSPEVQRNIIAERILGMPREPAADRDVAFKHVPRGHKTG